VRSEYRASVPQQLLTDFGEQDAAAGAFDHRCADHTLEFAQMLTDRGLTQVQSGRRPVESAAVRDCDEAAQRRNVEDLRHGFQASSIIHNDQSSRLFSSISSNIALFDQYS
jgi:hypothetical protein